MSNLQLPTLTYAALAPKIKDGQTLHIGYMTTATKEAGLGNADFIFIKHHYNVIAVLYKDGTVYVSNVGWSSSTTRNRINHVLRDNDIDAGVSQYKGDQVLRLRKGEELGDFSNATFDPQGRLSAFNDHTYEGMPVT